MLNSTTHILLQHSLKILTNERLKRKKIKRKKIKNTDVQRCSKTVKLKIRKNKVKDLTASKIISSVGKGLRARVGLGEKRFMWSNYLKMLTPSLSLPKLQSQSGGWRNLNIQKNSTLIRLKIIIIIIIITIISIIIIINN